MTERERMIAALTFKEVDYIPFQPGWGRESTMERWRREGLPAGMERRDVIGYACKEAGYQFPFSESGPNFPMAHIMIPQFEEKLIERRSNSQVVQDWKGNICEIGLEFDVSYLKSTRDFVTRSWLKCPVENRRDWEEMKKRYNPDDPARWPVNAEELGRSLADRDHYLSVRVNGPYWQLREWCGFEPLSMMFYDDAELVMEMIDFWKEFVSALLERLFRYVTPDEFSISEDMAYKGHSMLSPEMCRKFLMPSWKQWGEQIRRAGVPVYSVDSDGYIEELIPLWIESGLNACDPIEVAAGCDINTFRRKFGRNMAYRGGVDKRAIAKGGIYIEKEIERLLPVIRSGGYIPGCDHAVPSDVSWPDFVHYCKLLAQANGLQPAGL